MDATVIDIRTRKTASMPEVKAVVPIENNVYQCTRCNAKDQLFKLFIGGRVQCGDCSVTIDNLVVAQVPGRTRT